MKLFEPDSPWLHSSLFVGACAFYFLLTYHGMGVGADSVGFLGTGTAYAPLYNVLLTMSTTGFAQAQIAAKIVNFASLMACFIISYWLVKKQTGKAEVALVTIFLLAINKHLWDFSVIVQNEILALSLTLGVALFWKMYLEKRSLAMLVVASIIAGLVPAARYAFVAVVATNTLFFLFAPNARWRERILNSLLAGFLSGATTIGVLWSFDRISFSGRVAGRDFAFNGNADLARYLQMFDALGNSVFISFLGKTFMILVFFVLISMCLWMFYHSKKLFSKSTDENYVALFFWILISAYLLSLLVAVQIEANLPLYLRYMVPITIWMTLATATLPLWRNRPSSPIVAILVTTLILYVPANMLRTGKYLYTSLSAGHGYNSLEWKNSSILSAVGELGKNELILSNFPPILKFYGVNNVEDVENKYDRRTGYDKDGSYLSRSGQQIERFKNARGYYVHFNITHRFYLPSLEEVIDRYGLVLESEFDDGRIYENSATSE